MNRRSFLQKSVWFAGGASWVSCSWSCSLNNRSEFIRWNFIVFNISAWVLLPKEKGVSESSYEALRQHCQHEIKRIERIFTLYEANSEIQRFNRSGVLNNPSFELLKALRWAQDLYEKSQGVYDPSIQSYWKWMQTSYQNGDHPLEKERKEALQRVDFSQISVNDDLLEMPKGFALTLNSISQGILADSIAYFLKKRGVDRALVYMGEYVALEEEGDGTPWKITLQGNGVPQGEQCFLKDQALAVSSGGSYYLSANSSEHHLLVPQKGTSPEGKATIMVKSQQAMIADGLATLAALLPAKKAKDFLQRAYPQVEYRRYSEKN